MFAILAASKVLDAGFGGAAGPVLLGIVTAIGGGLTRDVLAGNETLLMKKELYAVPVTIGTVLFVAALPYFPEGGRLYVPKFQISLPRNPGRSISMKCLTNETVASFATVVAKRISITVVSCVIAIGTFGVSSAQTASEGSDIGLAIPSWEFGTDVYLFGADIGGKTTDGSPVDISFGDLIENLNLGFMGTLAARKGRWSLAADLIYLDVSDGETTFKNVGGAVLPTSVNVDLKGVISTFAGGYRLADGENHHVDAIAGGRFLWLDGEISVDRGLVRVSDKPTALDAIVRISGAVDLNEQFYLTYYADVGGGQSNSTWRALAGKNYRAGWGDVVVGYRYIDWDLDNFGPFDDLNVSGPFAGLKFQF
ncbi:UPF0126 membrane protein SCO4104 [Durusdinium trenchii]|uniref:UPF0126 membrane protein SCO4104 n=1 Tax=Durusdinium trenchii TaxID=1381693 RepID=A0ABP0MKS0_9DINO